MGMDTNILPNTGSYIRVTVRNPFWDRQIPAGPTTITYQGQVLEPHRWLTDREFCLSGDTAWPVRVINLGQTVRIDFVKGQGREIKTRVQTWKVRGSRGDVYTVTRDAVRWTCSCKGFEFRHACRHVAELAQTAK